MRVPLVLRAQRTGGEDDREFGKARRQRTSPAQMLAELGRVLAHFGGAQQHHERPCDAAAPAGDDHVVDPALRFAHRLGRDLAVAAHFALPLSDCDILAAGAWSRKRPPSAATAPARKGALWLPRS